MLNTEAEEMVEYNRLIENLVKDCNTYIENTNRLNESGVQEINEGLWEKIKYGLSKLGRYKAGGKIFGKGKIDAAAAAQIKAIVDKKGNEVIKALDAKIKETNPKFPNNEKEQQFLQTILDISSVYDSIVAATKLTPNDKGFLPIDVANGVIEDLATYVKKYLDVDLAAVYSTMDEAVPAGGAPAPAPAAPLAAKDVRTQLQGKVGADATTRASQRMDTLKSNKLPLVLAGVGTALGALGWLAQTPWMQNLITNWFGGGTPAEDAIYKTVSGGAPDSQGMIHWMSQINTAEGGAPIKTTGDINAFIQKYGAENVSHMFDGNGSTLTPMEQVDMLQKIAEHNPNASVGEVFQKNGAYWQQIGAQEPTITKIHGDMKMGRNTFGISMAASFVTKTLVKQAVKATVGAGAGVAASVAGVGGVLLPLGIGLIGAGALVKLMRMKGQKQSRAKTLNDLFQSLQPIQGTEQNKPVIDMTDTSKGTTGADDNPKGGGDKTPKKGGTSTDDLYNQLKRFFQFVKNNENVMGGGERRPAYANKEKPQFPRRDEKGREVAPLPESEELFEGRYIQDKRTLQFLNKQMGSFDKIEKFEEFLTRLETIRNIVRKMNNTGDKVLDGFLAKMRSNPIMGADFTVLFNAPADDPKAVNSLRYFIEDMLKSLYSGQYKFMNIIDKIGTLGGGNINKLEEAEKGYNIDNPTKPFQKDVMNKETFKKNLISFVSELVNIFQYLHKKRGEKQVPTKSVKEMQINEQIHTWKRLIKF